MGKFQGFDSGLRRRGRGRLFAFLALSFVASSTTGEEYALNYATTVRQGERDEGEFIFRRAKNSLESIISGQFRAVGRVGCAEEPGAPFVGNDSELFCVFDFAKGQMRFDRRETAQTSNDESIDGSSRETFEGRHVISQERVLDWNSSVPNEIRVTARGSTIGSVANPFDVRTLGCVGIISINKNTSLSEVLANAAVQQIVGVTRTSDGLRVIEWTILNGAISKRIWFDDSHGGCPVRLEALQPRPDTDILHEWSEINWKALSGVWVPVSAVMGYGPRGSESQLAEYAFEWDFVNEPVFDEFFTAEGLKTAGPVWVIDRRLEVPIVLEVLNSQKPSFESMQNSTSRWSSRTWLIVIGIQGVLIAIVIIVVMRDRRLKT